MWSAISFYAHGERNWELIRLFVQHWEKLENAFGSQVWKALGIGTFWPGNWLETESDI